MIAVHACVQSTAVAAVIHHYHGRGGFLARCFSGLTSLSVVVVLLQLTLLGKQSFCQHGGLYHFCKPTALLHAMCSNMFEAMDWMLQQSVLLTCMLA